MVMISNINELEGNKNYINKVTRIHLKTDCDDRQKLIDFCLNGDNKYLAIGWSCAYDNWNAKEDNFDSYYDTIKNNVDRMNHVINVFKDAEKNDLFWTRDLDGIYWICRAKGKAEAYYDKVRDIGARIPVEAYKFGMEVPGQIKASFNRPLGGTAEIIRDEIIVEYSKYIYNLLSHTDTYIYNKKAGSLLDNLPDFDLEELVISYLQIEKNYYVLSNSIAKKSTTIKIECELISRDINSKEKAVVQVGGRNKEIDAEEYKEYANKGYLVYFYVNSNLNSAFESIKNIDASEKFIKIERKDLEEFYNKYKLILPKSITMWENLFEDK